MLDDCGLTLLPHLSCSMFKFEGHTVIHDLPTVTGAWDVTPSAVVAFDDAVECFDRRFSKFTDTAEAHEPRLHVRFEDVVFWFHSGALSEAERLNEQVSCPARAAPQRNKFFARSDASRSNADAWPCAEAEP